MSTITRAWLGFAAFGAGLIHLALVIGSPLPAAIVLVLVGAAEIAWGVLAFRRDRIALPRTVSLGALVPMLLWALDVAVAAVLRQSSIAAFLGFYPLAGATLLELFVSIVLAVHLRRGIDVTVSTRTPAAGLYLLGLMAGAILVGSVLAPALAATAAGRSAVPMDQMNGDRMNMDQTNMNFDH